MNDERTKVKHDNYVADDKENKRIKVEYKSN